MASSPSSSTPPSSMYGSACSNASDGGVGAETVKKVRKIKPNLEWTSKQLDCGANRRSIVLRRCLKTHDKLLSDIGRANALALILREQIGVMYQFQAYSPLPRPFLSTPIWKFGNSTVVFLFQEMADDDDFPVRVISAYCFYSFFKRLEELHSLLSRQPTLRIPANMMDDHDENLCQICFEKEIECVLPCAHSYCAECFAGVKELGNGCAFCRSDASEITDGAWTTVADNGPGFSGDVNGGSAAALRIDHIVSWCHFLAAGAAEVDARRVPGGHHHLRSVSCENRSSSAPPLSSSPPRGVSV